MRQTDDLIRQINKLVVVTNSIVERYARSYEELDGLRLNLEEIRELLSDYFEEASRDADRIAERLERLERLAILEKANANPKETLEIKGEITTDLRRERIRRELIQQTKNLIHAQERAAKYGIDIPTRLYNEIEMYSERIEQLKIELA